MKPKLVTEKLLRRQEKDRKAREVYAERLTRQQAHEAAEPTMAHLNQLSETLSGKPLRQRRTR